MDRIDGAVGAPGVSFHPRFSGRSALAEIVRTTCSRSGRTTVLLPDYICNVVVRAVRAGGGIPEYYPLNTDFETDSAYVARRVEQKDCAALVTASLYGADGGCGWIQEQSWRDRLVSTSTIFIADLCQDFFRSGSLAPFLPGTGGFILLSFNNKSFPGLMGGGFVTETAKEWPAVPPYCLSSKQRVALYRRYLLMHLGALRRWIRSWYEATATLQPLSPEHGDCLSFPYAFTEYQAEKEQLAAACAGLSMRDRLASLRSQKLNQMGEAALKTPGVHRAPYVAVQRSWHGHARQKAPYSVDEDPKRSLRPGLLVIHNKGFDDV